MLQRILVPTDGSELSRSILPMVRGLARAHGAEVVFAEVVDAAAAAALSQDDTTGSYYGPEVIEIFEEEATGVLAQLDAEFRHAQIPVNTVLLHGTTSSALLNCALELRPDLVVMTTHGRTGLARVLFGSIADRMLLEGTAPVLLVREGATAPLALERALVALDGSPLAEEALTAVELLPSPPLLSVTLLRVINSEANRARAVAYLEEVAATVTPALAASGIKVLTEVRQGRPEACIAEAAQQADVVLMATHGRGGLDRLRHGSVTQAVLQVLDVPVMAVRPRFVKMGIDVEQFLRGVRAFRDLSTELLSQVAAVTQQRSFERGDVIIQEGNLGVELFVVRHGQVEVQETRDGATERLRVLGPGDIFGEIAILEQTARTASVRALEPTTCLTINGLTLRRILEHSPETAQRFHETVAERLGMQAGPPDSSTSGPS